VILPPGLCRGRAAMGVRVGTFYGVFWGSIKGVESTGIGLHYTWLILGFRMSRVGLYVVITDTVRGNSVDSKWRNTWFWWCRVW
jgi:hypothetical protein